MIFKFIDFINEVKSSKLNFFKNPEVSSLFTSSIEIEMETLDKEGIDEEYTDEYVSDIISKIRNSVTKELNRISNFEMTDDISEFIDDILYEIESEYYDYDYIDKILNERKYGVKNYRKLIVQIIRPQVLTYFFSDNYEYLEGKFRENLPNFYQKYKDIIKFELDNTLDRGIEISNKKYFNDINNLIEMIEDFYNDFNNQNYWILNDKTGIHINIGPKDKSNFNIIKGLLFLSDMGDDPFIFKNMEWRKNSKFCGSLLSSLVTDKSTISKCDGLEINQIEEILNKRLNELITEIGYKNFGVNIVPIKKFNYIEYRYPGGTIDKDTLINKVLYFTYVTYQMCHSDFERKEYIKKLYKFIDKYK